MYELLKCTDLQVYTSDVHSFIIFLFAVNNKQVNNNKRQSNKQQIHSHSMITYSTTRDFPGEDGLSSLLFPPLTLPSNPLKPLFFGEEFF